MKTAADELRRLREENAALAARLAELESSARMEGRDDETLLLLDEDPEALKRKVDGFIEAIDQYLEQERARG